MQVVDGTEYYTAREIAEKLGKSKQTFNLYDRYSNELEEKGEARLIPKPIRLGPKRTRYWNKDQVEEIVRTVSSVEYGSMAEFNRTRWGKRYNRGE